MTLPQDMQIMFSNHSTFYAIAFDHYRRVHHLVKERAKVEVNTDRDVDRVTAINAAIQRSSMVTVIFSALTLEAFINQYAIEAISRNYFDEHLDKLSTPSKWFVIPQLTARRQMDRNGHSYGQLKGLFKLRHRLVHYKARRKKISELREEEDWITERHAEDAIRAVESAVKELGEIDPKVSSSWLEDAKTDLYA